MGKNAYDLKSALPNKVLDEDGNVTDLFGKPVNPSSQIYVNKPSLPNKWLNPDGTYSTLTEIMGGAIDTNIFVTVEELPETGDPKKIYLVPDKTGKFIEYHWTGDKWDPIGMVEFNLSDYSTTQEMMNAIEASALQTLNEAKKYTDDQIQKNITKTLGGEY